MDNPTLISLTSLITFIVLFLSWLIIKTLKEGKEALKQMGKNGN